MRRIKKSRMFRKARYIIYRETVVKPVDLLWTFIGSFIGIGSIGILHEFLRDLNYSDQVFLIGSFGASAVLVYGATNSPLAQPRNLIGGHLLSAIVGVTTCKLLPYPELLWLSAALAVSLAILLMIVTKTLHPPGGATALIAIIGSQKIKALGYFYVVSPVLIGVIILVSVAMIINNIPANRNYPYRG